MVRRLLDACIVYRLRHGESWLALPLWTLAILLLAVPGLGLVLVVPTLALFFAVVTLSGTRTERRDIELTREGVRIGRVFVPRTSIKPTESPQRFIIEDPWRRISEIVVYGSAAEEMRRLERRACLRRYTIGAYPLYESKLLLVSVAIACMFSACMGEFPFILACGVAVPVFGLLCIPGRIDVGPDGLELGWLFIRKFAPARTWRSVRLEGDVVYLDLADGSTLSIPTRFNLRVAREIASRLATR